MKKITYLLSALVSLNMNAQTIPNNIPTNGLVGYWPFSNNANDISGNNNNGAGTNVTATTDRYGNSNSAYEFNGVSSNVLVPNSSSFNLTNAFTVSMWIKSNTINQNSDLIEKFNYTGLGDGGFQVVQRTNGLIDAYLYKNNTDAYVVNQSVVSTTTWEHIVLVWDGSIFKTYKNLILNGQANMAGPLNSCANELVIGCRYAASDNYFNGKMDDIAIWDRALSFAEISGINCTPNSKTITPISCGNYTNNSVTYTTTGIYTQTLTNVGGCDSLLTIDLTINNANNKTITPMACGNYINNSITYTATGIYTQTLTNVNGCDSILTIDLTIENIDATVTQNGNILSANATGLNYQWIDCNNGNTSISNEINQTFTASVNGVYAAIISSTSCTVTSTCYTITTTGLNSYQNSSSFIYVYPNPANHSISIAGINNYDNAQIKITAIDGKLIKALNITSTIIDVNDLTKGMYFMELTDKTGQTGITKFIKE